MTTRLTHDLLTARNEIVAAPSPRACDDRSFELPARLYGATALMFTGFVLVLGFAFRHPQLAVPFGVIIAFLSAFFIVPSLWPRLKPVESRTPALGWSEFMENGINTATGRTSGAEATVLVLLLPFLILCFAIAVATIAALA
jgi:hypothetical protein